MISVNTEISPQIQILYKDKPVRTLSLILLKFENAGNEPIRETDYSKPVRILLSPNAEVGEVTVQETKPEGILLSPTVPSRNEIQLARILLNPGDQAVLKVLALNNDGTLNIDARIVGISDLAIISALESSAQRDERATYQTVVIMFGAVAFILLAAFIWFSKPVIEWRRKHYGFEPAKYYYRLAQEAMLSKDKTTGSVRNAISYLEKACYWDKSYAQKAQMDPLFAHLHEYDKFKTVIGKY